MVTRRIRGMWLRERSRRFAVVTAAAVIVISGLPALLKIGPADLAAALPLVVCAVFMILVGARHSRWLALVAMLTACVPISFTAGEEWMDAIRNGLFVSVATLALAWAHRRQRQRLQQRARARRKMVGRVKDRAKQLRKTGSELRIAVERSEVAQRTLLEHLPVHVLHKDLAGRFTFASQSFCQLLKRDVKEVLGRTDHDFYDSAIADKFRQDDERVARDGTIVDDVERTQLPDGSVAYMQVRKAPLRDPSGQIVGVQGIFWDVTETLRGRKQLQRIESWAHALIQAALDAVLIVDVEGRVLQTNPAVQTIMRYHHEEGAQYPPLGDFMRASATDIVSTDSGPIKLRELAESATSRTDTSTAVKAENTTESSGADLVLLNRLLKQATGRRIEVRLRRHDDSWFDAEISAHPLVVENSSGWAIFVRDITRRKRSVSELQAAKEAAERANSAKSEFVANVSHELRTPLTGIVGLHELLERSELDDQQREYIGLARTSSDNLLALIDALLDFSKIEAHRLEMEHAAFDLIECIESAALSLAPRAQLRGLELIIDCAADLPNWVYGDQQRVRQVLVNLIGNAIKFTQRGDIRVRATQAEPAQVVELGSRRQIMFEVIDAGIGISEETQAVIFEAFRQADSSTTRRYGGTGLGLAICRELVTLMGGSISVRSEPQQGSTFSFTLPLELAPDPQTEQQSPYSFNDKPQATAFSSELERYKKISVALVAQATQWRDVLERELVHFGCAVECISVDQLLGRQPKQLFAAGNHTFVVADFRELSAQHPTSLPVVERIILAVPIAFARPTQTPSWLRHADFYWLPRPIRRAELRRVLSERPTEQPAIDYSQNTEQSTTRAAEILLVEDSPINQAVLQGILKQLGHRVSVAHNGEEAVSKCASQNYDVVLMDIQMPEVDGMEATRRIREHERTKQSRPAHIIALTAHAMPSDREQSRAAGMNGFLVKPIPLELLRQAIASVPNLHEQTSGESVRRSEDAALSDTFSSFDDTRSQPLAPDFSLFAAPVQRPDWPMVAQMLGGNVELAHEVVDLLRFEAARLFHLLCDNCALKNAREARRAAHTLRSNLRNVGLSDVAAIAGRIETLALASDWSGLHPLLKELEVGINEVVNWCDGLLAVRP